MSPITWCTILTKLNGHRWGESAQLLHKLQWSLDVTVNFNSAYKIFPPRGWIANWCRWDEHVLWSCFWNSSSLNFSLILILFPWISPTSCLCSLLATTFGVRLTLDFYHRLMWVQRRLTWLNTNFIFFVDGAKINTPKTCTIEYTLIMRMFIITSNFHVEGFGSFINKLWNL